MNLKKLILLVIIGIVLLAIPNFIYIYKYISIFPDLNEWDLYKVYLWGLARFIRIVGLSCLIYYFVQLFNKYPNGRS